MFNFFFCFGASVTHKVNLKPEFSQSFNDNDANAAKPQIQVNHTVLFSFLFRLLALGCFTFGTLSLVIKCSTSLIFASLHNPGMQIKGNIKMQVL